VVLIVLEIRERDFDDTALERIVRILQTAGAVDDGLSDASRILVSSNVRHCGSAGWIVVYWRCTHSRTWKVEGA
jgi:hypothetical protein